MIFLLPFHSAWRFLRGCRGEYRLIRIRFFSNLCIIRPQLLAGVCGHLVFPFGKPLIWIHFGSHRIRINRAPLCFCVLMKFILLGGFSFYDFQKIRKRRDFSIIEILWCYIWGIKRKFKLIWIRYMLGLSIWPKHRYQILEAHYGRDSEFRFTSFAFVLARLTRYAIVTRSK